MNSKSVSLKKSKRKSSSNIQNGENTIQSNNFIIIIPHNEGININEENQNLFLAFTHTTFKTNHTEIILESNNEIISDINNNYFVTDINEEEKIEAFNVDIYASNIISKR